ncbi:hypothetical protein DFH94DRAFT_624645, partial [Russula ochroleuca]
DTPSLTVTISKLSSSSPFPSPGSPFFPPPIPSAHEYAPIPLPSSKRRSTESRMMNVGSNKTDHESAASQSPSTATPTTPPPSSFPASLIESAKSPLDNNQSNLKSPSRNSLRSSRDSLTSSRPAPPSPAGSRRTSAALSRHSSTRSPRRASSSSAVAAPAQAAASMAPVKIRDFAFPDEDARHAGTGPLTPRPNRRLQRPLSTEHDDPSSAGGGGPYGFTGWGLGRLGWFGARSSTSASAGTVTGTPDDYAASTGSGPSQRDFARNFTDAMSPEYEADDPYESLDDDDDDDDVDDDRFGGAGGNGEQRPLIPGLYRALYVFEPEGTAEMALEEDQIVRVIGRGGGVGWAIVARDGDEGHALVPEGYLELVSLDRDSEQVGEEDG